jgi:hypothetical protein
MCLTSHWPIVFNIRVSPLILNICRWDQWKNWKIMDDSKKVMCRILRICINISIIYCKTKVYISLRHRYNLSWILALCWTFWGLMCELSSKMIIFQHPSDRFSNTLFLPRIYRSRNPVHSPCLKMAIKVRAMVLNSTLNNISITLF